MRFRRRRADVVASALLGAGSPRELAMVTSSTPTETHAHLELRQVGKIEGEFFVARYQRGYRWGPPEVERLLDDLIASEGQEYSLQPVVVKRHGEGSWELVDGQQRLTTLFLLYRYMKEAGLKNVGPRYSLEYETRPQSKEYLSALDEKDRGKNIDFFHLYDAYECIAGWFEKHDDHHRQVLADDLFGYLFKSVRVIWYEAPPEADAIEVFRRLNIGRIPLTDAELVKAVMLSKARGAARAEEVAAEWDGIERDLRNPELWAFVTETPPDEAPTRISLLLDTLADLISAPPRGRRPRFYTFHTLRDEIERTSWTAVWHRVVDLHARIRGWYENRRIYHLVGYLVAVGRSFGQLVRTAEGIPKSSFRAYLDEEIRKTLELSRSGLLELSYERSPDKLERALLLMNIETVCRMENSHERYSFHLHHAGAWSLEHIHAQQAQELNRAEQWNSWLDLHSKALAELPSVDVDARAALLERIEASKGQVTRQTFAALASDVVAMFREEGERAESDADSVHAITNLALIETGDNAALGNSVFEVKRRKVLDRDRRGGYIPECTRRVFLKYYTDDSSQQVHFWGAQDRDGYRRAMVDPKDGVLTPYLRPDTHDGTDEEEAS